MPAGVNADPHFILEVNDNVKYIYWNESGVSTIGFMVQINSSRLKYATLCKGFPFSLIVDRFILYQNP